MCSTLPKQHQVTLRFNDDVDENIQASAILLSAALRNLLENAIRHAPENSGVTLSATEQQGQLRWTVEDEGPGVFGKITFRANPALCAWTPKIMESGLGLAIVDAIVRRLK